MKEVFTVIDLKTTGLNHEKDQIIEIAALKTDLDKTTATFETRVQLNRGNRLTDEVKELTGITEEDLENAETEPLALLQLAFFIQNTTVVAHNVPFNFSFLSRAALTPRFFLDTKAMSAKLYPDTGSWSLKSMYNMLGVKLEEHHRALSGVKATAELLKHLLTYAEKEGIPRVEFQNVVISTKDRPITFVPKNSKVEYK